MNADGFSRRRLGPSQWALLDDGVEVGRYGGRAGDRWAQLADGTDVTEGSPCSAASVRALLVGALPPAELRHSDAYADDAEAAQELWDEGFRPARISDAASVEALIGHTAAYRATDIFQLGPVGPVLHCRILRVTPVAGWEDSEWEIEHTGGDTHIEEGDELWTRPMNERTAR